MDPNVCQKSSPCKLCCCYSLQSRNWQQRQITLAIAKVSGILGAEYPAHLFTCGGVLCRTRTDLEFLQRITTEVRDKGKWNAVLLGRKTWESLDSTQQPLPGRLNVVISKTLKFPPCGAHHVCDSVSAAVQMLSNSPFTDTVEEIFVLGGTEVYREAIESSFCYRIYLTEIDKEFESDTFFPTFDKNTYRLLSSPSEVPRGVIEENQIRYRFCVYEKYSEGN